MSSENNPKPIDPAIVRELAEILNETDLTEIEVRQGELKLRISRTVTAAPVAQVVQAAPAAAAPAPVAQAAPAATDAAPAAPVDDNAVASPMVGTVYLRPSPDADAFFKEGDAVKEGDTVLLIEAMKTFNPIAAPSSGTLKKLLVTDAQPVEFGEALFVIE